MKFAASRPREISEALYCGGKSTSFHLFSGSLRQSNRNSKESEKQIAKSGGDEGLMILEFRGYWGVGGRAFWNICRQGWGGGIRMFLLPVVGYGYFLESLIYILMIEVNKLFFFFHCRIFQFGPLLLQYCRLDTDIYSILKATQEGLKVRLIWLPIQL